ncbi:hypothetical protein C5167_034795 [Papaver somniferum]|uniref:Uncharacterized protein n=1 Tax=Papaver somniferum TaxID=3469 RepID=A0A4Y7KE26_PAPSO|nr:hypothetical protein C5167_034795 [Papaver somniferum]
MMRELNESLSLEEFLKSGSSGGDDGGCGGVPMATVMDIEGEKVVLKVKRDPGYLPKYQLTNLEYSRKIQDFDECFKDSPNFENLENSNAVNFTRHCREEMDG